MTRKDSEKESDRPHYYSQFWLDVAAGRTTISTPKEVDEIELAEVEEESEPDLEPTPLRRAGRNHGASSSDGYKSTRTQTMVEPEYETGDFEDTEEEEFSLADADDVEELELPDNVLDETEVEMYSPEEKLMPDEEVTEEDEEDVFYDEEMDEDEDEEEEEWGSRGRKKPKPGRQTKAPKSTKKPRRETRRNY